MEILKKYSLHLTILIGTIILAVAYTNVQDDKEYRQKIVEDREYIAMRKQECLEIYNIEGDKWTNVVGWSYRTPSSNPYDAGYSDMCVIEYKGDDGVKFEKDF